ncbi:amino acid ABC transporter ATP-binding protein [Leuconostoc rapi]|uniref:amino acid ABC transporter ATP-binding protein n=1 Tax=Leuconostoc rapi TaxID=1406906 RepID=UPI00195F0A9B|nr:amino acid ABC transporter ATP-binding protein [Leuconostoc rapi]MBM7435285.1 cystine transport system ATP-binding protein [Leuconostoc rapi]
MIQIENLNKSFNGKNILNDINLTFDDHKTTVILGTSGAGKSTLLRTLNVLEKSDHGAITIDDAYVDFDKNYSSEQIRTFRSKTSMVFQTWNLFPHLSVIQNITKGPVSVLKQDKNVAIATAETLLTHVGLADYATYYPAQLSGGQQQRVAIARSLAMKPSFILLDEPTSALDPESEANVLQVLQMLSKQGQSLVIVTHNMIFARQIADRVVFLDGGKITYNGDSEGFFDSTDDRIQRFLNKRVVTD